MSQPSDAKVADEPARAAPVLGEPAPPSPTPGPEADLHALPGQVGSGAEPRPTGRVAPPVEAASARYFEDVTDLIVRTIEATDGPIIGWAHDRPDPDTMGGNALLGYLLKEKFGRSYTCYYSKRMTFLMNRSLAANFVPSGLLRRCEQTDTLSEIAHKAALICILDATCPEIMTDFAHLIRRSPEVREKPILFIDHHRKGTSDVEDLPNATGARYEAAQATSAILVHVLRNLGLDLKTSEEGFRLAVVARAGIDTDLIGVDPQGYTDSTRAALAYLDEVLGEKGRDILERLKAIKHPLAWYQKLGQALAEVEHYDTTVAVAGLGVIDDTGIVPFVANRLMSMCPFKTVVVFGITYDRIEGQLVSVDLDASGRSTQDQEIVLPDLFHEVFFVTDPIGRKTSKGGGRTNALLGDYSGAGASVPLDYWRQLPTKSADDKIELLRRLAWPAEFLRIRHLLASRAHALKPEKIRSVVPLPALDGL